MEFTGERYVPELGGEIRLEHVHRYAFCRPYIKGKVVVDVACGEGYGSAMLADHAARVIGIDVSESAITHAKARYAAVPQLAFQVGDAAHLDLPPASVDVVVSFETIEHLHDQEDMLAGFARILKPSGLLILSSPDKQTYSDETHNHNEFHVKELYRDELTALIGRHFRRHELLGQRIVGGSSIFSLSPEAKTQRASILVDDGEQIHERPAVLDGAVYFIALATNASSLPPLRPSTVLSEVEDPIVELKKIARWASGVHDEMMAAREGHVTSMKAREEEIDKLQRELQSAQTEVLTMRSALTDTKRISEEEMAALRGKLLSAQAEMAAVLEAQTNSRSASEEGLAELREDLRLAQASLAAQDELRQSDMRRVRDELVTHWSQRARKLEDELRIERERANEARQLADRLDSRLTAAQETANAQAQEWQARLTASDEEAAAEIAHLRRQIEGTRADATATEEALRQVLASFEASHQQVSLEGGSDRGVLEAQVGALTLEMNRAQDQIRALAQERDDVLERSKDLAQRTFELEAAQTAVHKQLEDATLMLARHDARSIETDQELGALRAQCDLLSTECIDLRAELLAAQDELHTQVTSSEDLLRAEREDRSVQARADAASLEAAHQRMIELETSLDAAAREHAQALQASLQARADAEQNLIARNLEEVRQLEERIQRLEHLELAPALERARDLHDQLASARAELRQERHENENRARWEARSLEAANARIEDLKSALEQVRRDHAQALQLMREAHAGAEQTREEHSLAQTRELQGQIQQLQGSLEETARRHVIEVGKFRAEFEVMTRDRESDWASERADLQAAWMEREDDLQAEIAWWRHEVTEARRQLQQLRVAQQRQADAATRGIHHVQQQHAEQLGAAGSALAVGLEQLRHLTRGLGNQLEALRLDRGHRRGPIATAIDRLHQWHQLAHEAIGTLGSVRTHLGLPSLAETTSTLADLMALDDRGFVKAAYLLVLQRDADPAGQDHYLQRLRSGEQRLRVLSDLQLSPEGRTKASSVVGLDRALQALRKRQLLWPVGRQRRALQQSLALAPGHAATTPSVRNPSDSDSLHRLERSVDELGRSSAHLAEAVPIAVSLGRAPRELGLDPWACAQELVRTDDHDFIELAHGLINRRPPGEAERKRDLHRLAAGSSRVHLIDLLLHDATSSTSMDVDGAAYRSRALLALGGARTLPVSSAPAVSIVVAARGRLEHTLRCLQSIRRHAPTQPFEVIVVDDASTDHSPDVLAQVAGIRLARLQEAGGLAGCFNCGAKLARGEWLHLLSNDSEVHENWLDELSRTFDIFPGTGLAGSKLLQPNGSLLSAGRVLWRDGTATEIGREAVKDAPEFAHAREVDGCAAVSILVPKSLFDAVGGFPQGEGWNHTEDRALSLALAERGYRTIYQALSVVTCHGAMEHDPVHEGSAAIRSRYASRLETHAERGSSLERATRLRHSGRLLAIEHRLPRPDRDAGSVSVFNMLMAFRELGIEVSLIAEADLSEGVSHPPRYVELLQRSGIRLLTAPHVHSVAEHLGAAGTELDAVLLYRPVVMERYGAVVAQMCPNAKRLYYPHDLHFLRLSRQAQAQGDTVLAAEAEAQRPRELALHLLADRCMVASEFELQLLIEAGLGDNASWLPLLLDCTRSLRPAARRKDMLFVGSFRHAPNVHALRLLLEEVMPRVRHLRPDLELWVVGEAPPPELVARGDAGVNYLGAVDDLTPWLDRVRVAVAPLKFGAGAKGKVARPMCTGVPVVASAEALEGMHVTAGEHVLQADNADAFAAEVVRLHQDDALWHRLSDASHRWAVQEWGPKTAHGNLANILNGVGVAARKSPYGVRFFDEPHFLPVTSAAHAKAADTQGLITAAP